MIRMMVPMATPCYRTMYAGWRTPAGKRRRELIAVDAAINDAHAVAWAQVIRIVLHHGAVFAIVEAHADLVSLRLLPAAFHLVADHAAGDGARYSGGRASAARADGIAQQGAGDAADHGAGAAGLAATLHDLDGVDGAVHGGLRLVGRVILL